jgi:hypothetical protein
VRISQAQRFLHSRVFSHVQFGRSEFWKRRKYFCSVLRSAPTWRRARRTGTSARGFGRYMLHWLRTSTGRYHGTLVVGVIHVVSSSILVYSSMSAPLYVQQFRAIHGGSWNRTRTDFLFANHTQQSHNALPPICICQTRLFFCSYAEHVVSVARERL